MEQDEASVGPRSWTTDFSMFGSPERAASTIYIYTYIHIYGSQLWPLWHDSVNKVCIQWRNALRKVWKLPYGSHKNTINC